MDFYFARLQAFNVNSNRIKGFPTRINDLMLFPAPVTNDVIQARTNAAKASLTAYMGLVARKPKPKPKAPPRPPRKRGKRA